MEKAWERGAWKSILRKGYNRRNMTVLQNILNMNSHARKED